MTTATTTGRSRPPADTEAVFGLLRRVVDLVLSWSFEGTMRSEQLVKRVARVYGADVEVAMTADSAVLTMGERSAAFSRAPTVPPLDQVSDFKLLLQEIETGRLTPEGTSERIEALRARPPRFSPAWQVVGLGLFATGFGVSVQATGQEVIASGVLGLIAAGTMLTFSMKPADFPWALGILLLTAGVDQLATKGFGEVLGTFFGAIAMTMAALLVGDKRGRPPAYVLYLGAFYVLTPGSHGLRGFESWLGGHAIQGFKGVSDMIALLTALAVGVLVGAAASNTGRDPGQVGT